MIGEDLRLKPSTVEQVKIEYSPLGKIFNKGLSEDDKKEGLLKRLKHIEDKNEKLPEVKHKANENIREVTDFVDQPLSFETKELIKEISAIQKDVDYRKLKPEVVTIVIMILVITKHLKNYLEIFITNKLQ